MGGRGATCPVGARAVHRARAFQHNVLELAPLGAVVPAAPRGLGRGPGSRPGLHCRHTLGAAAPAAARGGDGGTRRCTLGHGRGGQGARERGRGARGGTESAGTGAASRPQAPRFFFSPRIRLHRATTSSIFFKRGGFPCPGLTPRAGPSSPGSGRPRGSQRTPISWCSPAARTRAATVAPRRPPRLGPVGGTGRARECSVESPISISEEEKIGPLSQQPVIEREDEDAGGGGPAMVLGKP